jgi:hypothetical protein
VVGGGGLNRGAQESTILSPQFSVLGLQFLARGGFWCVTQGLIKNTVLFSKWGLPILIRGKFQIGESPFQKRVCNKSGINILYETKTTNSDLENYANLLTFKFRWKFKTIGTKYPCVYSHPVFFG